LLIDTASLSNQVLTTWLMLETFDYKIVTASPIDGFLSKAVVALNCLEALFTNRDSLLDWTNLDNIFL